MNTMRFVLCACVCLLMAAGPAAAQMYDVYKNGVPDADKLPGTPPPDNSCWINSAANALAGGGWGTGPDVQARADNIRNDLTNHFGTTNAGWSSLAINWWLFNHGLNSGSADYDPAGAYTDVTYINQRLKDVDYDFLLDELARCQYVNVSFTIPFAEAGHEMTLVGGNYSPAHVPPPPTNPLQVSVWHDGDRDQGGTDDDQIANVWKNSYWDIDYWNTPENPDDDWEAMGATLLCPGLTKPDDAMRNFDVAWFKDMDPAGNLVNDMLVSGEKA